MRPYEAQVREFPRPWSCTEDWQYEVHDASGKLVFSTPYGAVAQEIIVAANGVDAERDELVAALRRISNEEFDWPGEMRLIARAALAKIAMEESNG